jgi:hypothetical protein
MIPSARKKKGAPPVSGDSVKGSPKTWSLVRRTEETCLRDLEDLYAECACAH